MEKLEIRNLILIIFAWGFLLFASMPVSIVSAKSVKECKDDCVFSGAEGEAYNACSEACESGSNYDPAKIPQLDNPLAGVKVSGGDQSASKKLSVYVGGGIQVVLGIVGSISLVMFIYAGIRYMLARGNADEAKAAGNIMAWAALGLAVIFGSYVILQFVFKALTG